MGRDLRGAEDGGGTGRSRAGGTSAGAGDAAVSRGQPSGLLEAALRLAGGRGRCAVLPLATACQSRFWLGGG